MSAAAILALLHDLILTAGVYSLVGFEVTPGTVVGLLTILGFSLYDTVVVFDKVAENTKGLLSSTRTTYGEAANLAVNQTLMRSINTSVIGLLPVGGLLFVGAGILGVGTLEDLALVLFVGMLTGAYSSLFLATPWLVDLKLRDPKYKNHTRAGAGPPRGPQGGRRGDRCGRRRPSVRSGHAGSDAETAADTTTPTRTRARPHRGRGAKPAGQARRAAPGRPAPNRPGPASAASRLLRHDRARRCCLDWRARLSGDDLPEASRWVRTSPRWSRRTSSTCRTSRSRASCSRT